MRCERYCFGVQVISRDVVQSVAAKDHRGVEIDISCYIVYRDCAATKLHGQRQPLRPLVKQREVS